MQGSLRRSGTERGGKATPVSRTAECGSREVEGEQLRTGSVVGPKGSYDGDGENRPSFMMCPGSAGVL